MRKKNYVRIILSAVLIAMFLTASIGCSAPRTPNTEQDLEILFWESGLGSNYMHKINEEFSKLHPEINIHFTPAAAVSVLPLYASPDSNTVDLYFTPFESYLGYTEYLEPLNDLAAAKADGNNISIDGKIGGLLDWLKAEDNESLYVLPYASTVNGLVYNADIFEQEGYKIPRTTSELIALADEIQEDYTPFIYFFDYWRYVYDVWIAQLEGVEKYFDIWAGKYEDQSGTIHENDIRAFTDYTSNGRYESMNVLQKLLSLPDNIYYGTTSLSHTAVQTRFLAGQAVMMPNGSWIENEMQSIKDAPNIRMMKTPVISALAPKLNITENQLRAAISYVDGTATPAEQAAALALSADTLNAVRETRGIMYTEMSQHTAFIPKYSVAKEAAKEYLKFYFSDAGMRIMAETTHMPIPAALSEGEIDTSNWSVFSKEGYEFSKTYTPIFKTLRTRLFYKGGIRDLFYYNPSVRFSYSQNANDMWNLSTYIEKETGYWTNGYWNTVLNNSGLS